MTRIVNWVVLLLLLVLVGCSGEGPDSEVTNDAVSGSVESVITDEQVQAIGKEIEAGFKNNPVETYLKFFDLKKVLDDIKNSPQLKNISGKDMADIEETLKSQKYLDNIKQACSQAISNSNLTFVCVKRDGQYINAVMRLEPLSGGVNYWLVRCVEKNGVTVADDLYLPVTGGTLNNIMATSIINILQNMPGFFERLLGNKGNMDKMIELNRDMNKAYLSNQTNRTITLYEAANGVQYKCFSLDFLYILALQKKLSSPNIKDEELYLVVDKIEKTISAIKSYSPEYIGGDLLMIDVYTIKGDAEKVTSSINVLRNIVGDDSYLDFLEGMAYKNQDPDKSIQCFKTAGKKGLRSKLYLQAYYLTMEEMPNSSKKAMQKIMDTGIELYGPDFKKF